MLTLCLQAGGKSSRMGQDKALLDFGGKPLIQRVLERLDSLASETIVTTNHPEGYRFLGFPLIPDVIPNRGALGGLYTALLAAHQPLVAVVACDLPFASPEILRACRDQLLANPNLDAVIPETPHGLEPLHAVYRRETCLPTVKAALETGKWKMIAWHLAANIGRLSPEEIAALDPEGLAFWNVNTQEEFDAAIQRFKNPPNR
jgi:molybdopterin-guanine dinucleotide biosynthesis protein A